MDKHGREWTVSIAVSSSVLSSIPGQEMKTYISAEIARALAIFNIDEVIIYNPSNGFEPSKKKRKLELAANEDLRILARILQYLECPQYLRKYLFPMHDDLKFVGLANPLDAPHQFRREDVSVYREGVVVSSTKDQCSVDVGLYQNAKVFQSLPDKSRVTLKFRDLNSPDGVLIGDPVDPSTPRTESGQYWGYEVRVAENLSDVFTQSPHSGGYDRIIGFSDDGDVNEGFKIKKFNHLLVFMDSQRQLLNDLKCDPQLGLEEPKEIFSRFVNPLGDNRVLEDVRIEEYLFSSLPKLREKIRKKKLKSVATNES